MRESPVFMMRSETRPDGSGMVFVEGELDLVTAPQFRDTLIGMLRTTHGDLIVDAAGVTFMDSQGVHAIAAALQVIQGTARRVTIRNPNDAMRRVLALTGLDMQLGYEV